MGIICPLVGEVSILSIKELTYSLGKKKIKNK